ncbi:MAG: hypothetical protein JWO67_5609 [Streptosporangiaceae bacterium]|nr:hypothetical protein [Streptosporangiaceae bacterium]
MKYVVKQLTKAGYQPQVQDFPFCYFKEKSCGIRPNGSDPDHVRL